MDAHTASNINDLTRHDAVRLQSIAEAKMSLEKAALPTELKNSINRALADALEVRGLHAPKELSESNSFGRNTEVAIVTLKKFEKIRTGSDGSYDNSPVLSPTVLGLLFPEKFGVSPLQEYLAANPGEHSGSKNLPTALRPSVMLTEHAFNQYIRQNDLKLPERVVDGVNDSNERANVFKHQKELDLLFKDGNLGYETLGSTVLKTPTVKRASDPIALTPAETPASELARPELARPEVARPIKVENAIRLYNEGQSPLVFGTRISPAAEIQGAKKNSDNSPPPPAEAKAEVLTLEQVRDKLLSSCKNEKELKRAYIGLTALHASKLEKYSKCSDGDLIKVATKIVEVTISKFQKSTIESSNGEYKNSEDFLRLCCLQRVQSLTHMKVPLTNLTEEQQKDLERLIKPKKNVFRRIFHV